MTAQQSKWNADAEMSMQGFVIPVESPEHLTHMVEYVLKVLKFDLYGTEANLKHHTNRIVEDATSKYNSSKDKSIKFFTVNDSMFGVLMTFVRDKTKLTSRNGVLAWVENIDAPDCSELGYVFFQDKNGKIVRIG